MCAKKGLFELHKVYIQRLNSIIKTIGYVLSIELARVEISLHQPCEVKYSIDGAPKQDTRYATASQKVHSPQCVKNLVAHKANMPNYAPGFSSFREMSQTISQLISLH